MEWITNLKSEHLQDASLEELHHQGREWLSELEFWIDEMTFYYKLLHMREPRIFFPTAGLAELEKVLVTLTSDHLMKLKIDIENHERVLATMIKNISLEEEDEYRAKHKVLLGEVLRLQERIREFKKSVFSFIG